MAGLHTLEFAFRQALLRQRMAARKQQKPHWRTDPLLRRDVALATLRGWPSLTIILMTLAGELWLLATFGLSSSLAIISVGGGLLVGLMVEAGLVWVKLNDDSQFDRALAKRLQPAIAFRLAAIRDQRVRTKLYKAVYSWRQVDETISQASSRAWGERLTRANGRVMNWVEALYELAVQTDRLRLALAEQSAFQRGRQPTQPVAELRQQLQQSLQQAETQFDQTLAALEVIHLQLILIVHKGDSGASIEPVQRDISDQITGLQDLTEAMEEVFSTFVSNENNLSRSVKL